MIFYIPENYHTINFYNLPVVISGMNYLKHRCMLTDIYLCVKLAGRIQTQVLHATALCNCTHKMSVAGFGDIVSHD